MEIKFNMFVKQYDRFYVKINDGKFIQVEGTVLNPPKDLKEFEFFIHSGVGKYHKLFTVSEAITGLRVIKYNISKQKALIDFIKTSKLLNSSKVFQAINKNVNQFGDGISPRYRSIVNSEKNTKYVESKKRKG